MKECSKGSTIKRNARIGADSTILPDITIGREKQVGEGSVVVEEVSDRKLVVGNPAKVIKNISELTCPYGLINRPYAEFEL